MITIWRQDITLTEKQTITAPGLRRIVAVDNRRGQMEVWFEAEPGKPVGSLDIWIVGTGYEVPWQVTEGMEPNYLGHMMTAGGAFVWHLYSVETPE